MKEVIIFLIIILLLLVGLLMGYFTFLQEDEPLIFKEFCHDGVIYIRASENGVYQGFGFMSAKFNADSKVVLCSKE